MTGELLKRLVVVVVVVGLSPHRKVFRPFRPTKNNHRLYHIVVYLILKIKPTILNPRIKVW